MSGHSKWANIKRKKEANDKVKGVTFAKLSRIITLAVIEGGGVGEPENNVRLRLVIEKAKSLNMPKEKISRAIEKGIGPNRQDLKEVVYEGFAPHGVSIIILAATDNSNRTIAEIRNVLERRGGKLGTQGSVNYLFQKCGVAVFELASNNEADLFTFAEKINAFDIEEDEETFTVYFPFENLGKVGEYAQTLHPISVESEYKPLARMQLEIEQEKEVMQIMEALEEMDDVQNVYSNVEFRTI